MAKRHLVKKPKHKHEIFTKTFVMNSTNKKTNKKKKPAKKQCNLEARVREREQKDD